MQQSGEKSWDLSTRPKRQRRPPQYLEEYELGPERQGKHVSPRTSSLQYMHGEEGFSSYLEGADMMKSPHTSRPPRQVQWDSDISEHAKVYSPSDDVHSTGLGAEWIDTPAPYAEGRNEQYVMYREDTSSRRSTENVQSSPSQLWGVEREIRSLTAQQGHGRYHPLQYWVTSLSEGKKMSIMTGCHLHHGPLMSQRQCLQRVRRDRWSP